VDPQLPASEPGAAISRFGTTDWECRQANYDALTAELGAGIEEFVSAHAADIRTAR
jgi:hypothetical protein